jgi:hypothetical protein
MQFGWISDRAESAGDQILRVFDLGESTDMLVPGCYVPIHLQLQEV